MTWLIIFFLCCVAGGFRYIEGASNTELPFKAKIPSATWRVGFGLCFMGAAYLASSTWTVAVFLGAAGLATISAGFTKWENLIWQISRGGIPGIVVIWGLYAGHTQDWWILLTPWALVGLLCLYVLAYAVYFGVDKIKPPIGHWEQWCRFIQAFSICLAGALI